MLNPGIHPASTKKSVIIFHRQSSCGNRTVEHTFPRYICTVLLLAIRIFASYLRSGDYNFFVRAEFQDLAQGCELYFYRLDTWLGLLEWRSGGHRIFASVLDLSWQLLWLAILSNLDSWSGILVVRSNFKRLGWHFGG